VWRSVGASTKEWQHLLGFSFFEYLRENQNWYGLVSAQGANLPHTFAPPSQVPTPFQPVTHLYQRLALGRRENFHSASTHHKPKADEAAPPPCKHVGGILNPGHESQGTLTAGSNSVYKNRNHFLQRLLHPPLPYIFQPSNYSPKP
jgi:hypothetical protein